MASVSGWSRQSNCATWCVVLESHERSAEGEQDQMRIREAELRDATAMARVMVDSFRSAHRDHLPEASLTNLSRRGSLNGTGQERCGS